MYKERKKGKGMGDFTALPVDMNVKAEKKKGSQDNDAQSLPRGYHWQQQGMLHCPQLAAASTYPYAWNAENSVAHFAIIMHMDVDPHAPTCIAVPFCARRLQQLLVALASVESQPFMRTLYSSISRACCLIFRSLDANAPSSCTAY